MTVDRVKIVRIVEEPEGQVEFVFLWNDNEHSQVFTTYAAMLEGAMNPIQTTPAAIGVVLAWWISRDPDGSNQVLVLDKEFKIDYGDPNPIKVN